MGRNDTFQTYEPDDLEELNRNEANDYLREDEDRCPLCGGALIEDDGLQCQECLWKEDNEIDEEELDDN